MREGRPKTYNPRSVDNNVSYKAHVTLTDQNLD